MALIYRILGWLNWLFVRTLVAGRYKVQIIGKEKVFEQPGPYLLLANHPAYVDPPILMAHLWPSFQFRPMLLETMFKNPVLAPMVPIMRAIKVPDIDRVSTENLQRAHSAMAEAVAALQAGDNVALWPSGKIMRDGVERIGGTRSVAEILAAYPDVTVVLARTRGLWGSIYSYAPHGEKPNLVTQWLVSILYYLVNLIFFTPRRHMTITLESFTKNQRPEPTRELINRWMEEWFNADVKPEPPTYVRHHFLFAPRQFTFPPPPKEGQVDVSQIKPSTKLAIAELLSERLKRPLTPKEQDPDLQLSDLGLDSLEVSELTVEVEQRFGFRGETNPATIGQLWALAEGKVETGEPPKPPAPLWFKPHTASDTVEVLGNTVPEALLNRVLLCPQDAAVADDLAGVLTYERLLIGALTLGERFRQFPEPNVGLLIPASAGGLVALLGMHLAGKLPVILNWTTGPANMAHAVKITGVTRVITSKRFIDRTHIEVPGTEYVFLEELRGTVGKWELLKRLIRVRYFTQKLVRDLLTRLNTDPRQHAVILFTSGSEKQPKAVPLTHANLIADMRAMAPLLNFTRHLTVLVFLPFFHSFGHTVTGLFTIFGGIRVVYHPDPTDASGLIRKIVHFKTTALAATPTFLGFILDRCKPGELDSLQVIVVGAEKCSEAIFAKTREMAPNAVILEGYGITECSPVVSVNPLNAPRPGTIGKPGIGIEVYVTDLETGDRLPTGSRGMLNVSGPTIFPGYLEHMGPSPFREMDGKRWYITGDLAELDAEGYIHFHGRLKRFLKAGGEMISLPQLEEPFAKLFPPTDDGPRVAVEGVELPEGKRKIVLFTTAEYSLKDANAVLHQEGHRGIMRLDEIRQVERIPVLGSGKTDYKILRGMIEAGAGS